MAISKKDASILWGKAAARCSEPSCHIPLVIRLTKAGTITTGEMAHIVGRRPSAARAKPKGKPDDSYENLVLLCPNHHTEVDKGEEDYPVVDLRRWKQEWEQQVARLLVKTASTASNPYEHRVWMYFNFDLILKLFGETGESLPPSLESLRHLNVVNANGFPIDCPQSTRRMVFECWSPDRAHTLKEAYSEMVEHIIRSSPPLDLDEFWNVTKLRGLLYPGAIAFVNRGLRFKSAGTTNKGTRTRQVYCRAQQVELKFQIDTWNMYGESTIDSHCTGSRHTAALLLIRDIKHTRPSNRGKLVVTATPLALGAGFWQKYDKTPAIANRRRVGEFD
jgi:hypothetical protein